MTRIHTLTILEFRDDGTVHTLLDRSHEVPFVLMRADRGIAKAAGGQSQTNQANAAGSQAQASEIGSNLIPGLITEATHPTGLTATQRNQQMVSSQEATGGTNAAIKGMAGLAQARTKTAGGYAPALAEAARQKMRQQATDVQHVNDLDTQLALEKQQRAQQQLQGLYGIDTSNALKSMGLANENLGTELAAGRQGWLQNTEGALNTLGGLGLGSAKLALG